MMLAKVANQLNSRHPNGKKLPAIILMTDEVRLPNPQLAAASLPAGSGVILRHYTDPRRRHLAEELARLCRERRIIFLVAGDGRLARKVGADGVHFPEFKTPEALRWSLKHPGWLVTSAAHSKKAIIAANQSGVNAVLVGPVFSTSSHPGANYLGPTQFASLCQAAGTELAVYALGGLTDKTAPLIIKSRAAGIAGISGLR